MFEGLLVAAIGALGILTVFFFYPLALLVLPHAKKETPPDPSEWPRVTVITGAHNAAALLLEKIKNFQALDYPQERLSFLIASDASTDSTREVVNAVVDPRIRLMEQSERLGKAAAVNQAAAQADGELLLFSDADALLAPDAVKKLARHFSDPRVGGVCGLRVPASSSARHGGAQQTYISFDSRIKKIESAHGRISSNDGKIHMIRRNAFADIPTDVTDDLYTGLSVIHQGFSFLFDPEACAEVRMPSRNLRSELARRRRIVTRSLTGITRMRQVLNPSRFGWFAWGLMINKIGRRLLPFFLLMTAAGIGIALFQWPWALMSALVGGSAFVAVSRHAQYVAIGLIGTAWGVLGFLRGRRISVWEPGGGA